MASVERRFREHCRCKHGCPTYADVVKWSCGCVEVAIHRDRAAGRDCTQFSEMRKRCGRPGKPGD